MRFRLDQAKPRTMQTEKRFHAPPHRGERCALRQDEAGDLDPAIVNGNCDPSPAITERTPQVDSRPRWIGYTHGYTLLSRLGREEWEGGETEITTTAGGRFP